LKQRHRALVFQHIDGYKREGLTNYGNNRERPMTVGQGKRRSETVSVRLDPKLRYLAELASRKQRRTVSSFVEWAVETCLDRVYLIEGGYNSNGTTLKDVVNDLWDVDPVERFVKLAFRYPDLLNHEEQVLWRFIRSYGFFWKGHRDKNDAQKWIFSSTSESDISGRNLRQNWDVVKRVARGELPITALPNSEKYISEIRGIPRSSDDDDGDVPF
jgi:hypothetical protein